MREKVRCVVLIAGLAMTASLHAALPIGETKLFAKLVDAKSGQVISGAIVAAAESYYWSGYHSSGTTCFRAASRILEAKNGTDFLRLPGVDLITSTRVTGDTRHIEVFAYRPGYCAAQPYTSASTAGFLKWANKNDPQGLWGTVASPKLGDDLSILMMPSNDPPEHRLRHLVRVARVIGRSCPDLKNAFFEALIPAMVKEADSLASTAVERMLAVRVSEAFKRSEQQRSMWAIYDGDAISGDEKKLRLLLDWAKKDPLFARGYKVPGTNVVTSMLPAPGTAALEPGFSINSRNERGFTPLMEAVRVMQVATSKLLLENGANINVVSGPGGYSALDLVLSRARDDAKETGTEGFEAHLLRMIDLLVDAKPAPSVHPRYHEELSDSTKWKLGAHAHQFWQEVQTRIVPLTPRKPVTLTCSIDDVARSSLQLSGEQEKSR